jgi:cytochrome d ubiquinol oxidase subunit II
VAGLGAIALLVRRRFVAARVASSLAVVAVIWGWAVGQYPYMLVDVVTVSDAAANEATLQAVLISLVIGSLLLAPSLVYLYVLFQRPAERGEDEDVIPQLPTQTADPRQRDV